MTLSIRESISINLTMIFLTTLIDIGGVGCGETAEENPAHPVHTGDLVAKRGGRYSFVQGNVIDCKNTSIDYLVGDIRGPSVKRVVINVMRGNIEDGAVSVNVLEGNIINGENVSVNVLIGKDFSGRARIGKQLESDRME
ncbi:MAG: hypothetical protein KDK34_18115 [Leptospiraceae bacterium]|nr:hypothetical protein [Leptospiraceae bacterium]